MKTRFFSAILMLVFIFISQGAYAESSPFFQLRNDETSTSQQTVDTEPTQASPDTPVSESTPADTSVTNDTSEAKTPQSGENADTEPAEKQVESVDTSDLSEEIQQQVDTTSPETDKGTTTDTQPTKGNSEKSETRQVSESTTERSNPSSGQEQPPKLSFMDPGFPGKQSLEPINSLDTATMALAPGSPEPVRASSPKDPAPDPSLASNKITPRSMYLWALAGAGIFLMIGGIIYIYRRPRVRVLKSDYGSINDYFQGRDSDRKSEENISSPEPIEVSGQERSIAEQDPDQLPTWKRDDEKLRDIGIDPMYRDVFELYYGRGLTQEKIADRTGFGEGEVGLVVDLLERSQQPGARDRQESQQSS